MLWVSGWGECPDQSDFKLVQLYIHSKFTGMGQDNVVIIVSYVGGKLVTLNFLKFGI